MAEIVGLDKIIRYLQRYKFRKIKLSKGADIVYTDSVKANSEEPVLLDRFEAWATQFIEPDNYKEYKLELFGTNKEEAEVKALSPVIKISVVFNSREYSPARSVTGFSGAGGVDIKEYTALAVENAKLTAQLDRLEEKLNDLISEPEEEPKTSIGEKIGEVLMSRADDIISLLMMKFASPGSNLQPISGVTDTALKEVSTDEAWEQDILDIAWDFKAINPDIKEDLLRLLNLAKTNKPFFDMLIKQLRSM